MYMTGDPEGCPMPVGQSIADVMTGVHAMAAIGYALFHRERTGKGQFLTSLWLIPYFTLKNSQYKARP